MNMKKSLYHFLCTQLSLWNRMEKKSVYCMPTKRPILFFLLFYSSTNGKISATKAKLTSLFIREFQVPMGKKPQGILHFSSFICGITIIKLHVLYCCCCCCSRYYEWKPFTSAIVRWKYYISWYDLKWKSNEIQSIP